jgi:hypothetical protein
MEFVSDLRQVGGFLWAFRFPPPIKLTHDITEILLKIALNTINQPSILQMSVFFFFAIFSFQIAL